MASVWGSFVDGARVSERWSRASWTQIIVFKFKRRKQYKRKQVIDKALPRSTRSFRRLECGGAVCARRNNRNGTQEGCRKLAKRP